MRTFDVVLYDSIGSPYRGNTPFEKSLGGSELSAILVAEELARRGLSVAIVNNHPGEEVIRGVTYVHRHIATFQSWKCRSLVVQRYSEVPTFVSYDHVSIMVHDLPGWQDEKPGFIERYKPLMIFVSEWQRSLYPEHWQGTVIPNMLHPLVYEAKHKPVRGRFIYASAALKGLDETVALWHAARSQAGFDGELLVCSPDYSVKSVAAQDGSIRFLGCLPLPAVIDWMATCEGMFYGNVFFETFCISGAMAEAIGLKTHIFCKHHPGALSETLNSPLVTMDRDKFLGQFIVSFGSLDEWRAPPNDYSAQTVGDLWVSALEL